VILTRVARWLHAHRAELLSRASVVGDVGTIRFCSILHARPIVDEEFSVAMEGEMGDELLQCLEEKIASGRSMVERLKLMDKIDGIDKLIRKIQQEIKFLEKARDTN